MKKVILILGGALVICLVLVVVAGWPLIRQIAIFSPIIMPSAGPAPANEGEARLRDIEYLAQLLNYDRNYDESEKAQFEQLMASGMQEAESMSLAELYLFAAEATALSDNPHTSVSDRPVQFEFNSSGSRFYHFLDGLYVVRALREHEEILGNRVTEIDGQPIEDVLAELKTYNGGPDRWRRIFSVMLLESHELLHAAGLAQSLRVTH